MTIDVLFLQRVCEKEPLGLIRLAKKLRKPVWVDYDDDLFRLPVLKNPSWDFYAGKAVQEDLASIIREADLVTSTHAFLRWGLQSGANVPKETESKFRDIPNAFNDFIWSSADASANKIIAWRGSVTHYADMEPYINAMVGCAKGSPGWKWVFMGSPHWRVDEIPGANVFSHTNLFDYMQAFQKLAPGIVIVPLIDNEFNRAKSNIAALEGIMAGAVIVAPNWPEWQIPGAINYGSNSHSFGPALARAMELSVAERAEMHTKSLEWVVKNRLLSNVNKARASLLEELTNRKIRGTVDRSGCDCAVTA